MMGTGVRGCPVTGALARRACEERNVSKVRGLSGEGKPFLTIVESLDNTHNYSNKNS